MDENIRCRRFTWIDRENWVKMVKKLKRPAWQPLFSSNKRPATHNEKSDPVASTSAGSNLKCLFFLPKHTEHISPIKILFNITITLTQMYCNISEYTHIILSIFYVKFMLSILDKWIQCRTSKIFRPLVRRTSDWKPLGRTLDYSH